MNRLLFDDIQSVGYTAPPAPNDMAANLQYVMRGAMARLIMINLWNKDSIALMPDS